MWLVGKGPDSVGRQLHGDKECPFSGVTNSGRVWRKVPESGAWSVVLLLCSTDGVFDLQREQQPRLECRRMTALSR